MTIHTARDLRAFQRALAPDRAAQRAVEAEHRRQRVESELRFVGLVALVAVSVWASLEVLWRVAGWIARWVG